MNTLAGQDVAVIYSPFLYMENIEPTVKSRHILPRGKSESIVAMPPHRGGTIPRAFISYSGLGLSRAKTGNQRGYMPKNKRRRFFYEKAGN